MGPQSVNNGVLGSPVAQWPLGSVSRWIGAPALLAAGKEATGTPCRQSHHPFCPHRLLSKPSPTPVCVPATHVACNPPRSLHVQVTTASVMSRGRAGPWGPLGQEAGRDSFPACCSSLCQAGPTPSPKRVPPGPARALPHCSSMVMALRPKPESHTVLHYLSLYLTKKCPIVGCPFPTVTAISGTTHGVGGANSGSNPCSQKNVEYKGLSLRPSQIFNC